MADSITNFKKLFPEYNSYTNEKFIMNELNDNLLRQIFYTLDRRIKEVTSDYYLDVRIKWVCDIISEYTNMEKTKHWGYDFMINDMKNLIQEFKEKPFHKFMDAISKIVLSLEKKKKSILESINEVFEENKFGYRLNNNIDIPWICINTEVDRIVNICEIEKSIVDISKQASDHIKQASQQLSRCEDSRARKDAIRDCLSCMETLLKKVTNKNTIKEAISELNADSDKWGPKAIISNGAKVWKLFHEDYKDIRHGDEKISDISIDQAIYFIDNILIFVAYISKIALKEKEESELIF